MGSGQSLLSILSPNMDLPSSDQANSGRTEKGTRTAEDDNLFESTEVSVDAARKIHEAMKRLMSAVDGDSRPEDFIRLTTEGTPEVEINEPKCIEYLDKIHDQIVELKQKVNKKRKANWSKLPNELVESILIKLMPSEFDILGFGHIRSFKVVCQSWRAAATSCSPYVPLPRTPCLLLHDQVSSMFDPIGKKVHKIRHVCDYFSFARMVGSSYGWIVMFYEDVYSKELKGHVFNPITRASIPIPGERALPDRSCTIVSKAIISSNPSRNKNFVVVVEYGGRLAYYKHGDEDASWKILDDGMRSHNGCLVFHDDHLVASEAYRGVTKVWNFKVYPPSKRTPIRRSAANKGYTYYLMESLTGEILRLGKSGGEAGSFQNLKFCVGKLNLAEGKWETLPSLEDQCLFLFENYFRSNHPADWHLMSLPNLCFLGCEKNSIYYGTKQMTYVRYDLKEAKVDSVMTSYGEKCVIKSFGEEVRHFSCRNKPLWIVPNPW